MRTRKKNLFRFSSQIITSFFLDFLIILFETKLEKFIEKLVLFDVRLIFFFVKDLTKVAKSTKSIESVRC
jgi:hypothetical protein